MSPIELERRLEQCDPTRREFLKALILGTAYATPIVASFGMDGLGVAPASASSNIGMSNLCEGLVSNLMSNIPTDVIISKTASPDPVRAGELLTYTIEVYNCGPAMATNVVVADQMPSGTLYVSSSQTFGSPSFNLIEPEVGEDGGLWQASANEMFVGATACFEVVVRVAP